MVEYINEGFFFQEFVPWNLNHDGNLVVFEKNSAAGPRRIPVQVFKFRLTGRLGDNLNAAAGRGSLAAELRRRSSLVKFNFKFSTSSCSDSELQCGQPD